MAGPLDVIVPIVVAVIIVLVSIYLFTMYCHPEEKGFGNEVLPKILVVLTQTLAWGQILLLPLDLGVQGASPGNTFYLVYYILYPIIFALLIFINPLAIFFYESDQQDSWAQRMCWSTLFAFIVAAIWIAYVFISYIWLGAYDISGTGQRINASIYIFLALSLIGWVMLFLNGGIGLVYLPYQLIKYFAHQPTPMTTEEAFIKKKNLEEESSELITQGEKLKQEEEELRQFQGGWFSRKKHEAKFQSHMQKFKKKVNKLQKTHQLFAQQLQQKQQRHPVVYIAALIFGIISLVLSVFWWFQILGSLFRNSDGAELYSFIDSWLQSLSQGNGSFFATLIYGVLVIYMQICLMKGTTVFGFRIPYLIKVHPMIINKTYMNSLLFNSNLMLLASCSISFQALWSFPLYFAPNQSYLSFIYNTQILRLPLFGTLYLKKIPMGMMEILVLVVFGFVVVRAIWNYCRQKKKNQQIEAAVGKSE